jgi:AraC-like DNA-binding protein
VPLTSGMSLKLIMKTKPSHEAHLVIKDFTLRPGQEWIPQSLSWSLIQVDQGSGYWLDGRTPFELNAGTVVLMGHTVQGKIRASQLGEMSLHFFHVEAELLTGLATLGEQRFFDAAARRRDQALHVLPAHHPVATRFKNLCASRDGNSLSFRLELLHLFVDVFGRDYEEHMREFGATREAKERLQEFLQQTTPAELLNLSFADLVQKMNCTPRHVSRVFSEVMGMSFREKQTAIRLARARELLASTESKVIDVALESGYQSLSLFSLMFRKRFGMSPGQWRRHHSNSNSNRRQKAYA